MSDSTGGSPVETIEDLVNYLEQIARENPAAVATTTFGAFTMKPELEPEFEEIATMIRLNGGTVAYTRTSDEDRVYWNRLTIQATNTLTAWFFRATLTEDEDN